MLFLHRRMMLFSFKGILLQLSTWLKENYPSVPTQEGWTSGNAYCIILPFFMYLLLGVSYCVGPLVLQWNTGWIGRTSQFVDLRMTFNDMWQFYLECGVSMQTCCNLMQNMTFFMQDFVSKGNAASLKVDWSYCQESRRLCFQKTHLVQWTWTHVPL